MVERISVDSDEFTDCFSMCWRNRQQLQLVFFCNVEQTSGQAGQLTEGAFDGELPYGRGAYKNPLRSIDSRANSIGQSRVAAVKPEKDVGIEQ